MGDFTDKIQAHAGGFMILPTALSGKVGMEHPVDVLRCNADPLVADIEFDVFPRRFCG